MDLESGLFRILDEALAAYLGARAGPRRRSGSTGRDQVEASRLGGRAARRAERQRPSRRPTTSGHATTDLPPALAAMMEDRRADARDAVEAARREAIVALPPSTWREIQGRAATLGVAAELLGRGRRAPARDSTSRRSAHPPPGG